MYACIVCMNTLMSVCVRIEIIRALMSVCVRIEMIHALMSVCVRNEIIRSAGTVSFPLRHCSECACMRSFTSSMTLSLLNVFWLVRLQSFALWLNSLCVTISIL